MDLEESDSMLSYIKLTTFSFETFDELYSNGFTFSVSLHFTSVFLVKESSNIDNNYNLSH